MALKIMILGANGFIGSALTNAILNSRDWEVYGIDLSDNKLGELPQNKRFHFIEGDITINKEWVEYHVKKCDVVVPLVAIANPAQYVTHPLRVFTQFLSNVLYKRPIKLVDGGSQKRSFTYIDDAIECLLTILENKDGRASRRIFNIGNPANCISIRDLAQRTIRIAQEFPVLREAAKATQIIDISAGEYYGKYYQDIQVRVPNIEAAKRDLGWQPTTDMDTAIRRTIDFYVRQEGFGTRAAAMAAGI